MAVEVWIISNWRVVIFNDYFTREKQEFVKLQWTAAHGLDWVGSDAALVLSLVASPCFAAASARRGLFTPLRLERRREMKEPPLSQHLGWR
jgi:hypothetical protein